MALLKDILVYGAARFISDIFGNNIYANKHITNGGTGSHYVKGDGNLGSISEFATSGHDHNSKYLRKDTNDSTSYQYTFSKTNDHAIQIGTIRGYTVGSQTGNYLHIYERVHIGSPSGWGSRNAPSYGLSTYGGAWLATDTGSVGIGTTSPGSYKLYVNGTSYLNGNTTVAGHLYVSANNTYNLGASGTRWAKLYVGTADSYGSTSKPIYWNAGVPTACTYELKATVNAGTANRLAYYSGANAISSSSIETNGSYIHIVNDTDVSGTAADTTAPFTIGTLTGTHISIDGNEILAKTNATTPGILYLQDTTGTVQVNGSGGLKVWDINIATGATTDTAKRTISSSSTLYLNSAAGTSIIFNKNGAEMARFDTSSNFVPSATNTRNLGSSSLRWAKLYVGTADSYGSTTKPIYWNAGVPAACTYELKSTVNGGTANRMAYYSGANAISSGSIVTDGGYLGSVSYLSINTAHQTSYRLYVNGTSYFNGNVTHNGIIYLANGTTYYIDNSAVGYLNDLRVDQTRLVDNWIGFYQSNNAGGNRYGYIQTDGSYMYFRKERGNNGFNFNGNLVPDTSNSKYLGTSSYYWHGAYINGNGNIHWNNLVKLSNTNIVTTDTNRGLPRILANPSTNMQQSGNRFYGLDPNSVKIEYTTNGSTWTTQTTSTFNTNLNTYKRYFTQGHWGTTGYPTRVGNVADAASGATCSIAVNMGTRITLDMRQENRTGWVECLSIYFLTRGHNCSFTVERQNTSSGTWTTIETGTLNNTNQIRTIYPTTSFYLQGNSTSTNAQYANIIRITMIITALGTAQRYAPMVGGICGIGTGGVGQTRNASYTVGRRSDLTMAQWGFPLEIFKPNNSVLAHGDYWQFCGAGGWIAANTNNYADIYIGTSTNKSVAGEHAEGRLFIYSAATHYHAIYTTSTTTHYYHYLPNSTGWIATGGNGSNTGAGSATNPVYLSTSGVLTGTTYSLSATVNGGTASRIAYYSGTNAISSGSITTDGSYLRSVTDLNSIHITPVTLSDSTAWTTNFDTNVFGSADNTNYKFTVIRGNAHVPAEFTSDWSCGIAFKGSDTKGMMSISYNTPQIKFAGGSGTSNLNWWMGITGTKEIIYNLDSWRPESITDLDTGGTKNGIYSHNAAATGRPSDNYGNLINISNQEIPAPGTANHWIQQLDFTHDGLLHHRQKINTTAWTGWATILDSSHAYIATTPVKTTSTAKQNITGTGNITPNSTNAYTLGSSSLRWSKLYVGTADSYGSTTKPIYWNAGVPAACTYELKSTVNGGTASRIAYYSGANAISAAANIWTNGTKLGINTTSEPSYNLYVNGNTLINGALRLQPLIINTQNVNLSSYTTGVPSFVVHSYIKVNINSTITFPPPTADLVGNIIFFQQSVKNGSYKNNFTCSTANRMMDSLINITTTLSLDGGHTQKSIFFICTYFNSNYYWKLYDGGDT